MLTEAVRTDLPNLITSLPGPRAQAIIDRDSAVLSPSYTRCYPLVVERGEGAIIEDVDGNRFLDFNAGIAVTSTGHCHPEVVAAIEFQAARLIHMSGTDFTMKTWSIWRKSLQPARRATHLTASISEIPAPKR